MGALQHPTESISESWADLGARVGGENEVLRNILIETDRRLIALDELKYSFGKLVDPISKALRALEQEKSDNIILRGNHNELRQSYDTLRAEFNNLVQRTAAHESEREKLCVDLDLAQQQTRNVELENGELTVELSTMRPKVADLERQLAQEIASKRLLIDENLTLSNQTSAADKRIIELENLNSIANERIALIENEKRSAQSSLQQFVADNSSLSRKLSETETLLDAARSKITSLEENLAVSQNERNRLIRTIDESYERHQTESRNLTLQLEGIKSRAMVAEKLLSESRQSLVARTEEIRVSERKLLEATISGNATAKKLEHMLAGVEQQDGKLRDLERSRATLLDRNNALLKTVKEHEATLALAEEKISALTDQRKMLNESLDNTRSGYEKRIDELKTLLQQERLERAVSEGALKATRKSYAELQLELGGDRVIELRNFQTIFEDHGAAKGSDKPADESGLVVSIIKT